MFHLARVIKSRLLYIFHLALPTSAAPFNGPIKTRRARCARAASDRSGAKRSYPHARGAVPDGLAVGFYDLEKSSRTTYDATSPCVRRRRAAFSVSFPYFGASLCISASSAVIKRDGRSAIERALRRPSLLKAHSSLPFKSGLPFAECVVMGIDFSQSIKNVALERPVHGIESQREAPRS